jgi:endonuclease YncB( thermonuclease family)
MRIPRRGIPRLGRLLLLALGALAALAVARQDLPPGLASLLPGPRHDMSPPARFDFAGAAAVVDGDTLQVAGRRIRLDGIDAPEGRQTCERGGFAWQCGADAAAALREALRGRQVACVQNGRDQYSRVLAHCWADGQDVGAWMVGEGLALAYTRYSTRYAGLEAAARRERRGLWAGRFEDPAEWRRRNPR